MKGRAALLAVVLGVTAWLVVSATPVMALSLFGDYYILGGTHQDTGGAGHGIDGAVVSGLVNGTLSPGASPTYTGLVPSSLPPATGGGSGAITDLSSGQIQWWTEHGDLSAGGTGVKQQTLGQQDIGTATSFLPTSFGNNFFAQGSSNGGNNGYRSVRWTGSFHVAGQVDLALTSDDDAWLFIRPHGSGNYTLLLDSGGVKAISLTDPVHQTHLGFGSGDWDVELFFADRHMTQSGVTFVCTPHPGFEGAGCSDLNPVPEPATLLLFGTTLAGVGAVVRRRMKGQKTPIG
jgi:hypothetical protein